MTDTNGGGIIAKLNNQQTVTQGKKTWAQFLEEKKANITRFIPTTLAWADFQRIAETTTRQTRGLSDCDPNSILSALIQAAQYKMRPNTVLGRAWIIPYGKYAQFQLGYKGILEFAYRSGQYRRIDAQAVREGDFIEWMGGSEKYIKHKESHDPDRENKPITHYFATYTLTNGGGNCEIWTREQMLRHRDKYSKTKSKDTPWYTNEEEMGKKVMLTRVLKYAPLSEEMERALIADSSIKISWESKAIDEIPPDWDLMNNPGDEPVPEIPESISQPEEPPADKRPATKKQIDRAYAILNAKGITKENGEKLWAAWKAKYKVEHKEQLTQDEIQAIFLELDSMPANETAVKEAALIEKGKDLLKENPETAAAQAQIKFGTVEDDDGQPE